MTGPTHALIGLAVLLVNLIAAIWAVTQLRRSGSPSGALRAVVLVGFALLVVQVLTGLDLFSRGARPAGGVLDLVHIGGPVLALIGAVYHLFFASRHVVRNYAVASLMTVVLGLISYGIGEMAGRVI